MEVILVMVIFAVGATIAGPKMQRAWDVRKLERAASSLEAIANAIRVYDMENSTITAAGGGGFSNIIPSMSFPDLLAKLEEKGLLNQTELTPGFCYDWRIRPTANSSGRLSNQSQIQSTVRRGGVCSTNSDDLVVYQVDFIAGRGYDKKIFGTPP